MASGDRSIASVLHDIVGNIEQIVRAEIRLAKTEAVTEVKKAGEASKLLAAGAVLGLFGFGFLLLSSVYLLTLVVAPWLAALIVASCVGGVAIILIAIGVKHLRRVNPTPNKTVASMKENVEWLKARTK